MTQLSEVYRRRGILLVGAMSQTIDGFWVTSPPYRRLSAAAPPGEVGAAVAEALAGSRRRVPNPPVRGGPPPIQPLLDLAGVGSWATFVKGAVLVMVEQERGSIAIKPQQNLGARELR